MISGERQTRSKVGRTNASIDRSTGCGDASSGGRVEAGACVVAYYPHPYATRENEIRALRTVYAYVVSGARADPEAKRPREETNGEEGGTGWTITT